jgi:hypothetical protein
MNDINLYGFEEKEFDKIGGLLADRDVFVLFFTVAKSLEPLSIGVLSRLLRREPSTLVDIFSQVLHLGLVSKSSGLYRCTAFGQKVMSFLRDITEKVELEGAPTESAEVTSISLSLANVGATNNSVVSNFRGNGSAKSGRADIESARPSELATESCDVRIDDATELTGNARSSREYYTSQGT